MLIDSGLKPLKHVKVSKLSRIHQRLLSVANAFVGGSKIVVMDEPTFGIDPTGKKKIWSLINKFRTG